MKKRIRILTEEQKKRYYALSKKWRENNKDRCLELQNKYKEERKKNKIPKVFLYQKKCCRFCKKNDVILSIHSIYKNNTYYTCNECNTNRARKYRKTIDGKLSIKKSRIKQIKTNYIKVMARNILNSKKKTGKIKQLPCIICGNTNSEAHHKDYTKPLDVIWLCRKHHFMI